MRTLKYAILGLVSRGPMTGYDLAREFSRELDSFWHARHSQIYPELKKLHSEGLLHVQSTLAGEVMEKKVYSITEAGLADLKEWLLLDEELEPAPKDTFKLRVYFSEQMTTDQLMHHLSQNLIRRALKLYLLRNRMESYRGTVPRVKTPQFGDYLMLREAILREESTVRWLEESIMLLKEAAEDQG